MDDNTPEVIAPDTDDLVQFEKLFSGKAEEAKPEETIEDSGDSTPAPEAVDEIDEADEKIDEPEGSQEKDDSKLKLKPKKTVQERINELTKLAREAERREADLAKKLEEVLAKPKTPDEEKPKPEQPKAEGAPTPEDIGKDGEPLYPLGVFDPAYQEARLNYAIERERENFRIQEEAKAKKAQEESAEATKAQQIQALQQSWEERVAEIEQTLPDIREKGATLESAFEGLDEQYGEYVAATLMSLDHGPEVLYYLAENPEEAKAIIRSGAVQATLALGKLEAQFSGATKKEVKVSNAPEPPMKLARGSGVKFTVAPDTDDLSAFEKEFFKR